MSFIIYLKFDALASIGVIVSIMFNLAVVENLVLLFTSSMKNKETINLSLRTLIRKFDVIRVVGASNDGNFENDTVIQ